MVAKEGVLKGRFSTTGKGRDIYGRGNGMGFMWVGLEWLARYGGVNGMGRDGNAEQVVIITVTYLQIPR